MKTVILIGPPGSGKGSNANLLKLKLNIPHLSTGSILRKEINEKTPIGLKIVSEVENGKLISDNIITKLVESRIAQEDAKKGFILDGYPRNLHQAEELDKLFAKYNIKDYIVIELKVDLDILTKRILGRYICNFCGAIYNRYYNPTKKINECDVCGKNNFIDRSDDNEKTIAKRFQIYEKETIPVLEFYKKKNKCYTINGMLKTNEILEIILKLK